MTCRRVKPGSRTPTYSTTTGEPAAGGPILRDPDAPEDIEQSPEEAAERDEELLDSLDEQLRVNREAHNQTRDNQ